MTRKTAYTPAIQPTVVPGVYRVESQYLAPGDFYTVDLLHETCTCPAGQSGFARCTLHGRCKHVRAAEAFHDARVLAQRAAVAA